MIVNIQQVNPPGPQSTGKFGHLITDSGKIFFPVDMMGEFQPGTTVDIRTKDQTWGATPVKVVASRPTAPVQGVTPSRAIAAPRPLIPLYGQIRASSHGSSRAGRSACRPAPTRRATST